MAPKRKARSQSPKPARPPDSVITVRLSGDIDKELIDWLNKREKDFRPRTTRGREIAGIGPYLRWLLQADMNSGFSKVIQLESPHAVDRQTADVVKELIIDLGTELLSVVRAEIRDVASTIGTGQSGTSVPEDQSDESDIEAALLAITT